MCGICGMIGTTADFQKVSKMNEIQNHRGPDSSNIWVEDKTVFGHTRLKIIDLSNSASQPMVDNSGRYVIVFNGEIYNYKDIKKKLNDFKFKTNSDTEVLLNAYIKWGAKALELFHGMFAFAIWDKIEKTLFCARDRFGIKPFYYTFYNDTFIFASEIKAFFVAGVKAEVNNSILYDYLVKDYYEHSNETFYKNIYKLDQASYMIIANGSIKEKVQYWNLVDNVKMYQESDFVKKDKLLELIEGSIKGSLESDVPIGIALSGGLDSATLLSLINKNYEEYSNIKTVSFIFEDQKYSEEEYIQKMVNITHQDAYYATVTPQLFLDELTRSVYYQDEPYAGLPIDAYSLCMREAKNNNITVLYDGSGIDEALGGYGRFVPAYFLDIFLKGDYQKFDIELKAFNLDSYESKNKLLMQMANIVNGDRTGGVAQDLSKSTCPECVDMEFKMNYQTTNSSFESPFDNHLHNQMYKELRYTKLPRALRFRDRLSMSYSIELRPPFLDHKLVSYMFSLDNSDYILKGRQKSILRDISSNFLPKGIYDEQKRSVQSPNREWFRNELKDWVYGSIDQQSFWNRGWIDKKSALKRLDRFMKGEGDNAFFIWQWINLELWAKKFLDKK